jgi:hypothetical protein
MSRKFKLVEMAFCMTAQKPVEQVKVMEVVIVTVLSMIPTTRSPNLTTIEVPMLIQV